MTKMLHLAAAAGIAISGLAATPAAAHDRHGYGDRADYSRAGYDRGYDRGYYGNQPYYGQPQGYYGHNRYDDRRQYCRPGKGTTGTIVGAVAGGLLGREIGRGGRWNRPSTTGAIIGAGAGALAGRAIERSNCR